MGPFFLYMIKIGGQCSQPKTKTALGPHQLKGYANSIAGVYSSISVLCPNRIPEQAILSSRFDFCRPHLVNRVYGKFFFRLPSHVPPTVMYVARSSYVQEDVDRGICLRFCCWLGTTCSRLRFKFLSQFFETR